MKPPILAHKHSVRANSPRAGGRPNKENADTTATDTTAGPPPSGSDESSVLTEAIKKKTFAATVAAPAPKSPLRRVKEVSPVRVTKKKLFKLPVRTSSSSVATESQAPSVVSESMVDPVAEESEDIEMGGEVEGTSSAPSASVEEPAQLDAPRPLFSSLGNPFPTIKDWSREVEMRDTGKERSAERKAAQKENRESAKAARKAAAEEKRAKGLPPSGPCKYCKELHWSADCPKAPQPPGPTSPGKRRAEDSADANQPGKKTKGNKNDGAPAKVAKNAMRAAADKQTGSSSGTPSETTTPSVYSKSTRRAKAGGAVNENFADGRYLYLKLPEELRSTEQQTHLGLVDIVKILDLNSVQPTLLESASEFDKKGWLLCCRTSEQARSLWGKELRYTALDPTSQRQETKEWVLKITKYHDSGARVFITEKMGAGTPPLTVAELLAGAKLGNDPSPRFSMFQEEIRGISGDKAIVVFETAPSCYRFEIPLGKHDNGYAFTVKFRVANLSGTPCPICRGEHTLKYCQFLERVRLSMLGVEKAIDDMPIP